MKKPIHFIIFLCIFLISTNSFAQKVELTVGLSGNLYNYSGSYASSNVTYNTFPFYSKTLTAGYGGNVQFKAIAQDGFILGLQTGYDVLRSRANVNTYYNPYVYYLNSSSLTYQPVSAAAGYQTSTSKLINANPYIGYRLKKQKYSIDFLLGGEIGFVVEQKQHQVLTMPEQQEKTFYYSKANYNYQELSNRDYRIKGGLTLNYQRFSIDIAYAHGINSQINIDKNLQDISHGKAYSQLIKLGVNYKIF